MLHISQMFRLLIFHYLINNIIVFINVLQSCVLFNNMRQIQIKQTFVEAILQNQASKIAQINIFARFYQLSAKMDEERRFQEQQESISSNHQKNPQRQKPSTKSNDKSAMQPQSERAPKSKLFKIYFLNRQKVYKWIIKQSKRLKLNIQTLSNAICLADKYFMNQELQPALFKRIGLVLMIISTKSLQQTNNNQLSFQQLLALQYNILLKFDFKTGQHNYVRTANYYMQKWDMTQKEGQQALYFLRDDQQSYVRYQKVLFLCYKFHLQFGNDFEVNIVFIIKHIVLISDKSTNFQDSFNKLEQVQKKEPFETLQQQFSNASSILSIEQYKLKFIQSELKTEMVEKWRQQVQEVDKDARQKYSKQRNKFIDYSVFINVPL